MSETSPAEMGDVEGGSETRSLEYVVRCGSMRSLGVMAASEAYRYRDEVVVRTERGTEIGTILCEATPTALVAMSEPQQGRVIRLASQDDQTQWQHLQVKTSQDLAVCGRCVEALKLP